MKNLTFTEILAELKSDKYAGKIGKPVRFKEAY